MEADQAVGPLATACQALRSGNTHEVLGALEVVSQEWWDLLEQSEQHIAAGLPQQLVALLAVPAGVGQGADEAASEGESVELTWGNRSCEVPPRTAIVYKVCKNGGAEGWLQERRVMSR